MHCLYRFDPKIARGRFFCLYFSCLPGFPPTVQCCHPFPIKDTPIHSVNWMRRLFLTTQEDEHAVHFARTKPVQSYQSLSYYSYFHSYCRGSLIPSKVSSDGSLNILFLSQVILSTNGDLNLILHSSKESHLSPISCRSESNLFVKFFRYPSFMRHYSIFSWTLIEFRLLHRCTTFFHGLLQHYDLSSFNFDLKILSSSLSFSYLLLCDKIFIRYRHFLQLVFIFLLVLHLLLLYSAIGVGSFS